MFEKGLEVFGQAFMHNPALSIIALCIVCATLFLGFLGKILLSILTDNFNTANSLLKENLNKVATSLERMQSDVTNLTVVVEKHILKAELTLGHHGEKLGNLETRLSDLEVQAVAGVDKPHRGIY